MIFNSTFGAEWSLKERGDCRKRELDSDLPDPCRPTRKDSAYAESSVLKAAKDRPVVLWSVPAHLSLKTASGWLQAHVGVKTSARRRAWVVVARSAES